MSEGIDKVTREALYEEVWADPVTTVASRYGLSDVGLAKICRKLLIPLPSRGYWAMVKAGRVMKKAKLPKLKSSHEVIAPIERISDEMIAAKKNTKAETKSRRKEIETITVETELLNPHPLVKQGSKRLKSRDCPVDEKGLRSDPEESLNLVVTKGSLDRALLLADALIKALELQGAVVSLENKQTRITLGATSVSFTMTEHVGRSRHEPTPAEERARKRYYSTPYWNQSAEYPNIPYYDYTPTGILTITVGGYPSRRWNDTPKTKLESRMATIVSGILELIEEVRLEEVERKRKEEAKQRARESYQFVVARYNKEMDRFKKFEDDADNFEKAQRLRAYADELERKSLAVPGNCTPETKEWLEWARAKADWVDPLVHVSDVILDRPKPRNPDRYYW
jgi:hypothetical protein